MIRAIGDIFKDGDVILKVELSEDCSSCKGCYYYNATHGSCKNGEHISGACTTDRDIHGIRTFMVFTKYDPLTIKIDLTEGGANMIREIGEIFNDNGVDLIVSENPKATCRGCYYDNISLGSIRCLRPRDVTGMCSVLYASKVSYRYFLKYKAPTIKIDLTE